MTLADLARVIRNRAALLRRDRWSRQRLLAHQARALAALRAFTYARSPFYQKFHAGLMDRPLEDLPVLTKAELMRNFNGVSLIAVMEPGMIGVMEPVLGE